jgi:hypothetical protein
LIVLFSPVIIASLFKPSKLVENPKTNLALVFLAAFSIPNTILLTLSGKAQRFQDDASKLTADQIAQGLSANGKYLETSLDRMSSSLSRMNPQKDLDEATKAMDTWFFDSADVIVKGTSSQMSVNAQLKNSGVGNGAEGDNAQPDYDEAGNIKPPKPAAGGAPRPRSKTTDAQCPPGGSRYADFLHDAALIKKYAYKTIVFLISFWSIVNITYLTFEAIPPRQNDRVCTLINEYFVGSSWGKEMGAKLGKIPIVGPWLGYCMTTGYDTFMLFNPFLFSMRFCERMYAYMQDNVTAFNESGDKKLWSLLLFLMTIYLNWWVFENFETAIRDVSRMKSNTWTSIVYFLFCYLYLESFITDFRGNMRAVTVIMLFSIFGLLFLLLYQFFLFFCMSFNTHIVVFLIFGGWVFFSWFGVLFFPRPTGPMGAWDRIRMLGKTIDASAEVKLKQVERSGDTFQYYFYKLLHYIHDERFFLGMLLWLSYVFWIFYRELRTFNLRQNMFFFITSATILLVLFKFAYQFLMAPKVRPAPHAASGPS